MSGGKARLLGRWGEMVAAEHLRERGYQLLGANYACRHGEIDLIAQKGGYLCFVEVKLRRDDKFAAAREFVDRRKQERIKAAAQIYLTQRPTRLQPRFDVIEVYAPQGMRTERPVIRLWENAF